MLFLYSNSFLYAFDVDAGEDQVICNGNVTEVQIGGNPYTAFNSTNPDYTYEWDNEATLSCSDCPNPMASPDETTVYEVTVTDGGGFVCTDEVEVAVLFLAVHPQEGDFNSSDPDKMGRVLISTFHDAEYYTIIPTAIGDLPAQHEGFKHSSHLMEMVNAIE